VKWVYIVEVQNATVASVGFWSYWFANFVLALTFPALDGIYPGAGYFFFALSSFAVYVITFFMYETTFHDDLDSTAEMEPLKIFTDSFINAKNT
jgi:hypothetical protein